MDVHSIRIAELHGQLEDVKGAAVTLGYDRELYRDLLRLFSQKVYGKDLSVDEISRRLDPDGDYEPPKPERWFDRPDASMICIGVNTLDGDVHHIYLPATCPYPSKGEEVQIVLSDGREPLCEVTGYSFRIGSHGEGMEGSVYLHIYLNEIPSD